MSSRRVGVVMGGASAEREISLRSGQAVAAALERLGHDVTPIVLGAGSDPLLALCASDIEVAFLALHGRFGEDGCVQGLLELMEIPYTGSSVLSSALAMDKLKAKEMFRLHNVPTPPYYALEAARADDLEEIHGSFGFPVIVKPRREGSSLGVSLVTSPSELRPAVELALGFDSSLLVERFVNAKEIAVGILDGRVLGAIEVAPKSGLYDFEAKYTPGATEYFMPARLPETRYRGVLTLVRTELEEITDARCEMVASDISGDRVAALAIRESGAVQNPLQRFPCRHAFDFHRDRDVAELLETRNVIGVEPTKISDQADDLGDGY